MPNSIKFLKGTGLSVEEALVFWRKSFSNMTEDFFTKNHAYNIRHNYGMEGSKIDYSPFKYHILYYIQSCQIVLRSSNFIFFFLPKNNNFSCIKIITGNAPGTGDHHGCPFRHFSRQNLEETLFKHQISPGQVREIMQLVDGRHYQIACTRLGEIIRGPEFSKALASVNGNAPGAKGIDIVTHPNQYFEAAFRIGNESNHENSSSNVVQQ